MSVYWWLDMELRTFGAILKFAMELEQLTISFYETAREIVVNTLLPSQFEALVQRGRQRLKTLEQVRRENTTEMILEPIVGLDSDSYLLNISIPSNSDEKYILRIAIGLERKMHEFYSEAAAKVEFLVEAAYSLEALADENEEAVDSLSRHHI
ncbi:MAG: hypothetical protein EAX81_06745 [Candidatus Thorarchaeota archaeon]|nr:hypothetical protein [Candidatus Thorarchaeota archaeon]